MRDKPTTLLGWALIFTLMVGPIAAGSDATPKKVFEFHKELRLPEKQDHFANDLPAHFKTPGAQAFDNQAADNPITDAGATLGRVLFYDTRLSGSGTVSCGSCHIQSRAFTDTRRFSLGHDGQATDRNSMGLVELRYSKARKMWDERAATLEEQALLPIQSPVEMGQDLKALERILGQDPRYSKLFTDAFNDSTITSERVAKALAQFVGSLVSYRSRYDDGITKVKTVSDHFSNFTASENLGKTLFLEKCAICHQDGRGRQSAFFSMFRTLNNGIDETADVSDAGGGDITLVPADVGLFRPSSLRNVEFTAPYMHDGRFQTLEEVVEHYSSGIKRHPNVSGFAFRMHFTPEEKTALVAFLKTLSDEAFLKDPRYSDPWHDLSLPEKKPIVAVETVSKPAGPSAGKTSQSLSADERTTTLQRGLGLPLGETIHYLHDLDTDHNHSLNRQESIPLAKLLLKNGNPPRFDRRRFATGNLRIARGGEAPPALMAFDENKDGKISIDELPKKRQFLLEAGDRDADKHLSIDEARKVETVERFLVLQDNQRDLSRIDRLVDSLGVSPEKKREMRDLLQQIQQELTRERMPLDTKLAEGLAQVLRAEKYLAFQDLLLVKQNSQEMSRRSGRVNVESIQERIFEFDRNQDGELNAGELEELAVVLEEIPGGFGSARPSLPSLKSYSKRLMARDTDHDGKISPREIPDRIRTRYRAADVDRDGQLTQEEVDLFLRNTAFDGFLTEGVYIGGGFANAFTQAEDLLPELSLSPGVKSQAKTLLETHDRELQERIALAVRTACGKLRELPLASPSKATARRPRE